jgi:hypothetical protein
MICNNPSSFTFFRILQNNSSPVAPDLRDTSEYVFGVHARLHLSVKCLLQSLYPFVCPFSNSGSAERNFRKCWFYYLFATHFNFA